MGYLTKRALCFVGDYCWGSYSSPSSRAFCWLDAKASTPGQWLFPLAVLLTVTASGEIVGLLGQRPGAPLGWVVLVGNLLIVGSNWLPTLYPGSGFLGPLGWPTIGFAAGLLLAFGAEMQRYHSPGKTSEQLALTMLGLAYVGMMLSFVVQLRFLGAGGEYGIAALCSLVIVVKMADIGAYTVGRLIGRHRMAPVLSPGKTYEGAVGGLVFACFGAWLSLRLALPALVPGAGIVPPLAWISFGLLIGLAGMFGDLAESLLKRDVGRKDSSTWMPGFGGVLDIIDSILLGGPVAYVCWVAWLGAS